MARPGVHTGSGTDRAFTRSMRPRRSTTSLTSVRVFLLGALGALGCDLGARASTEATADAAGADDEGASAPGIPGCQNPEPLLPGAETGTFRCEGDFLHRVEPRQCPSE